MSGELSEQEVVREIRERGKPQFDRYVDSVYAAHRSVRHGFEEVLSQSANIGPLIIPFFCEASADLGLYEFIVFHCHNAYIHWLWLRVPKHF